MVEVEEPSKMRRILLPARYATSGFQATQASLPLRVPSGIVTALALTILRSVNAHLSVALFAVHHAVLTVITLCRAVTASRSRRGNDSAALCISAATFRFQGTVSICRADGRRRSRMPLRDIRLRGLLAITRRAYRGALVQARGLRAIRRIAADLT